MHELTADRLRELLHFSSETGVFTWSDAAPRAVLVGRPAGRVGSRGYAQIGVDGRRYQAHRLAWLYAYGEWPRKQIDHINGARADNRLVNLRELSGSLNRQNQRVPRCDSSTGLLGVTFVRREGRFRARIHVSGRSIYLGSYATAEQAHAVYVAAKRKHHEACTI